MNTIVLMGAIVLGWGVSPGEKPESRPGGHYRDDGGNFPAIMYELGVRPL